MTINHVRYTSRKLAESLAGNPYMAVISITDPTTPEAKLDPLFRHVLRLSFFDAVPADEFQPPCLACSAGRWRDRSTISLAKSRQHHSRCR
jgi:hypothetical protein